MGDAVKKRWVLVTGGTRGIGKGLVEAFCRADYDVVFTYQHSSDAAAQLEQAMAASGATATGYRCDCSDETAVSHFAEEALAKFGPPYGIINNVGITRDAILIRMQSEQWRSVIDTNLNSAFYVTQAFAKVMLAQGDGVIIQMSSASGLKGNAGQTNYSATKAALIGLTRSLALELGRFNVRVNAIAPGLIQTEMVEGLSESKAKSIKERVPLRRMGTVEEVAALAVFLASQHGSYITGQTFAIDGGLTA